ncbi:M1 family aminopeptidase, partial [candidate division CSSED10-310 bacterium]
NLFPCHSEPADGLSFDLLLNEVPEGMSVVYPASIISDAPSYQIAWALGEYSYTKLGTTEAGTEIGYWILPDGENNAAQGCADLVAVFDWYEQTLGPYPFGERSGPVSVAWGGGAYGGMEHHPYWHMAKFSMKDAATQAHEAAHGWFGGGVRIKCWEDFVLSEGTVTYLTARASGQAIGSDAEADIWDDYAQSLNYILNGHDGIAWPDSCGEVDILKDGLFSLVPYIKGAYFYRAVAAEIGADKLDQVLSSFFVKYVGQAALMQDMIDHILSEAGFDASDLAEGWLQSLGVPDKHQEKNLSLKSYGQSKKTEEILPIPLDQRTWALLHQKTAVH